MLGMLALTTALGVAAARAYAASGAGQGAWNVIAVGLALVPLAVGWIMVGLRKPLRVSWVWFFCLLTFVAGLQYNGRPFPKRDMALLDERVAMAAIAHQALDADDGSGRPVVAALSARDQQWLASGVVPRSDAEIVRFIRLSFQDAASRCGKELVELDRQLATIPMEDVLAPGNLTTHERIDWGRRQVHAAMDVMGLQMKVSDGALGELDAALQGKVPERGQWLKFWNGHRASQAVRLDRSRRILETQNAARAEYLAVLDMMDALVGSTSFDEGGLYFSDDAAVDRYNARMDRIETLAAEIDRLAAEDQHATRTALGNLADISGARAAR
ncbi:hypothetical protein MNR01_07065 [Lysobacter sp. S4-A87]|uniref:hypothetical protein n=1 Tax=Lysobacter sp. S4-A87 TaxID=2925843 RepID=UPI001F53723E|nr:hypothetical protein [Lysobacter sp. S4-A87]UNK50758.1 hypothetical protein MNR01_07065 [Lysobacter sp. S4-A87]